MNSCSIDMHAIIKRLTQAKMLDAHAEAIAQVMANMAKSMPSNEYIDLKFENISIALDKNLQKLKADLLVWYIGVGLMQMTAMIANILLMFYSG
jgi:hypothetical protein